MARRAIADRYEGYLDTVEPALTGWVIDRRRPNEPVRLTVAIDQTLRLPIVADQARPDVHAATGVSNCGFHVALPEHLLDGARHVIALTAADGRALPLNGLRAHFVLGPVAAAIEPIAAADQPAVEAMLRHAFAENGADPAVVSPAYVAHWIATATGGPGGLLLAARVGAEFVGYGLIERGQGAARSIGILALNVVEDYRRKGLGERLLRALLAAAENAAGITETWLSVAPANTPARRLYAKLGFVETEERPTVLLVPPGYLTMRWRPGGTERR